MFPLLAELAADPTTSMLLADSGDGAIGIAFPFVTGPAVFAAVYGGIYRYYRNTDKRHHFARETEVSVGNLTKRDGKVGTNNRQKSRTMGGDNSTDYLTRVHRIAVK